MSPNRLRPRGSLDLGGFLALEFTPDQELLGPMIREKSIGLIAGPRGGGKSWNAMIFAYAIAGGKEVMPWGIGSGAPVTYLDGEMRATGVQERFRLLHNKNKCLTHREMAESNLHIVSREYIGNPIGSIDTEDGQIKIDAFIRPDTKLIILDNLSAWTSGGREDSNAWAIIKNWLINKRLQGVAVLLIHHTGKNGQQRGSSMHEDLLDYSILLSPLPPRGERTETRFGIDHTKLRDHIPELRQKYECSIWTEEDALQFEFLPAGFNPAQHEIQTIEMTQAGLSMTVIAKKMGISKSTVSRHLKKWRESQPPDVNVVQGDD
jgi:putative DNA primase/helicase